ncbi:MAG TPA: hypothetical protein ENH94_04830 [Phycisphaerales bacterium]|nr:hypothetical protein [Phycisphaerales bacterium]
MKKVLLSSDNVRDIMTRGKVHIERRKCPKAKKGDRLFVKEPLWVSECGGYYGRPIFPCQSTIYDVLSVDGKQLWHAGDKTPQLEYPDHRFMVGGYSRRVNTRCKKRHAFELDFGEYDTGKVIETLTGNTQVGESIKAVFMKRIPSTRMPKWAVRLWIDVVKVRGPLIEVEVANDKGAKWDKENYGR